MTNWKTQAVIKLLKKHQVTYEVAVLNFTQHVDKNSFPNEINRNQCNFWWNQEDVFPCISVEVRLMTTDVAAKHDAVLQPYDSSSSLNNSIKLHKWSCCDYFCIISIIAFWVFKRLFLALLISNVCHLGVMTTLFMLKTYEMFFM